MAESRGRAGGPKWLGAVVLLWAGAATAQLFGYQPGTPEADKDVKARFVLNFLRLTEWTQIPGERDPGRLPVCAIGRTEFVTAVESALTAKSLGGRKISFKIDPAPEPAECRAVILDSTQYKYARQALSGVRSSPVLTIGNGAGFLDRDGMFELTVQEGKVRFDVSIEAVKRARLQVSASLLRLCGNLRGGFDDGL